MRTYFFPSNNGAYLIYTTTPSLALKNKIDKFCRYSEWGTSLLEEGKELDFVDRLHGYIEDNQCYDNQHIFLEEEFKQYQKRTSDIKNRFDNFTRKVNEGISILEELYSKIKKYRNCKNTISKLTATLEKGYVINTNSIGGSKRARRYKKNSRVRYLTDHEMDKYKEDIENEERNKIVYKQAIKSVKAIEDVFFTFGMTIKDMKKESEKMNSLTNNYGETIFLFSIFEESIQKFDKDIYNKVLKNYKEVLRVDSEEKIRNNKVIKNKTNVYIDKDGNEHVIENNNAEQIIRV